MRLICLTLMILLAGCAVSTERSGFQLPTQPWSGDSLAATHLVNVTRDDEQIQFQARLSLREDRVLVVLLDSLGRRGATIRWSADGVTMERADWLPVNLEAKTLLQDLVLVYWPAQIVRDALPEDQYLLEMDRARNITSADGPIYRINRPTGDVWVGTSRLENLILGYQMTIQSVREPS